MKPTIDAFNAATMQRHGRIALGLHPQDRDILNAIAGNAIGLSGRNNRGVPGRMILARIGSAICEVATYTLCGFGAFVYVDGTARQVAAIWRGLVELCPWF